MDFKKITLHQLMTEYSSSVETAKKWGVTKDAVIKYIISNKIPGVFKFNNKWYIPNSVNKPLDMRFSYNKANK